MLTRLACRVVTRDNPLVISLSMMVVFSLMTGRPTPAATEITPPSLLLDRYGRPRT